MFRIVRYFICFKTFFRSRDLMVQKLNLRISSSLFLKPASQPGKAFWARKTFYVKGAMTFQLAQLQKHIARHQTKYVRPSLSLFSLTSLSQNRPVEWTLSTCASTEYLSSSANRFVPAAAVRRRRIVSSVQHLTAVTRTRHLVPVSTAVLITSLISWNSRLF